MDLRFVSTDPPESPDPQLPTAGQHSRVRKYRFSWKWDEPLKTGECLPWVLAVGATQ